MFGDEFFPTPGHVIGRMLNKVSEDARHFLEPSAGKGDIAERIKSRFGNASIDCIEQSPELASILTTKDFPIVGVDWLEYSGVCYYDAIIMNPPFSNGDDHLLHAWDFLHDGEIVCLLNEETIKNPHTASRKRLAGIIEAHGNVALLGDCFSTAQRKTSVNVAMVYLKKVSGDDAIELWAKVSEERKTDDCIGDNNTLALKDNLGNMQHFYDQANEHMLKAFQHLRKASLYMEANSIDQPCEGRIHPRP
jgi:methylase of polypeptide subunit release factors